MKQLLQHTHATPQGKGYRYINKPAETLKNSKYSNNKN